MKVTELKEEQEQAFGRINQLREEMGREEASYVIASKTFASAVRKKHQTMLEAVEEAHREAMRRREEEEERARLALEERHRGDLESLAIEKQREIERLRAEEGQLKEEVRKQMQQKMIDSLEAKEVSLREAYEKQLREERESKEAALRQVEERFDEKTRREIEETRAQLHSALKKQLQSKLDELQSELQSVKRSERENKAHLDSIRSMVPNVESMVTEVAGRLTNMLRASYDHTLDLEDLVGELKEKVKELSQKLEESETHGREVEEKSKEALGQGSAREACTHQLLAGEVKEVENQLLRSKDWLVRAKAMEEMLQQAREEKGALMRRVNEQEEIKAKAVGEACVEMTDEIHQLKESVEKAAQAQRVAEAKYATTLAENKRLRQNLDGTLRQAAEKETELKLVVKEGKVRSACFRLELRREDDLRRLAAKAERERRETLESEGALPLAILAREMLAMDLHAEVVACNHSHKVAVMEGELVWHREEMLKVLAKMDSSESMLEQVSREAREAGAALASYKAQYEEMNERRDRQIQDMEASTELKLATMRITNETMAASLAEERGLRGDDKSTIEGLKANVDGLRRELAGMQDEIDQRQTKLDEALLRINDERHAAEAETQVRMESLAPGFEGLQHELDWLRSMADGVIEALKMHDARWQGLVDCREEQYDAIRTDYDALTGRHDWLLARWVAREPREEDVHRISALQDELSRQMHMTAKAVQSARAYKEALRLNDKAYTQMFGMGALEPGEELLTSEKLELRLAALSGGRAAMREGAVEGEGRGGQGGKPAGVYQARRRPLGRHSTCLAAAELTESMRPESARPTVGRGGHVEVDQPIKRSPPSLEQEHTLPLLAS